MLKSLNILNFAVVDRLNVTFKPGLNVLTGETGSGKSVIVDALSLLMGVRGSPTQIRTGEAMASIEGSFGIDLSKGQQIQFVFDELGIKSSLELIIRREIYAAGRNRIFINGQRATISVLKRLQPFLADIYGQGEQRALLTPSSHRILLDYFGNCVDLKNDVRQIFLRLKLLERELKEVIDSSAEHARSAGLYQHQLAELEAINPRAGEDKDLLAERKILANTERIKDICSSAYQDLYENDDSILVKLAFIRRQLEGLNGITENVGGISDSLSSGIASLTDVAETLRMYASGIEYSPTRLAQVESRLAELEKLKRKYGRDLEGTLELKDELLKAVSGNDDLTETINALKTEANDLRQKYIEQARQLTALRCAAAPLLERKVMDGLRHLAMEQTKFLVSIETANLEDEDQEESPSFAELSDGSSGSSFFSQHGADYVEFLLSTNPGESPRPLSYVASGGELSRLMLTLRALNQEDSMVGTAVFDEIDVGIGGRVAEAVGQSLKKISAERQIFCVTHQAQIAKFAEHHYLVTKTVQNERTTAAIKELKREERVSELSRMIGGEEKAEKTLEAARWLLENVRSSPKGRSKNAK
jgi:DNA repair protein RecN (Recombination protein N)